MLLKSKQNEENKKKQRKAGHKMKKALKIIESVFALIVGIIGGLLFALLGFIFFPIYACDILYGEIWGYSTNE